MGKAQVEKKPFAKWVTVMLSAIAVTLGLASILFSLFLMFIYSNSPTFESDTQLNPSSDIIYSSDSDNIETMPGESSFGPIDMTPVE